MLMLQSQLQHLQPRNINNISSEAEFVYLFFTLNKTPFLIRLKENILHLFFLCLETIFKILSELNIHF